MLIKAENRYNNGYLDDEMTATLPSKVVFALSPRFTCHFIPYLGIDFIKINGIFGLLNTNHKSVMDVSYDYGGGYYYDFQLLAGLRGNTPVFFKCMSVYAALRAGYGGGSMKYTCINKYIVCSRREHTYLSSSLRLLYSASSTQLSLCKRLT